MAYSVCFFFSSRRRHTSCGRDWSSDVCSSDLADNEYDSSPGVRAGQERGHAASGRGGGGGRMEAAVGDRLHMHSNVVGHPERTGEIVEVAERADSRPAWCVSTTVTRAWCSPARTRSSSTFFCDEGE